VSTTEAVGVVDDTTPWHTLTPEDVFERQHVDERTGLSTGEADSRRARYGPNQMSEPPKEPSWKAFLRQYADPMQIVLLGAGITSLILKDWGTGSSTPLLALLHRA